MPHKKELNPNCRAALLKYQAKKREEIKQRVPVVKEQRGHPWAFKKLADFAFKADEYFESLKEHAVESVAIDEETGETKVVKKIVPPKAPTASDLAHALGVTRKTLFINAERDDAVGDFLKRCLTRIEGACEQVLMSGKPSSGVSLILRNGYGWEDVQQNQTKIAGNFSLSRLFDDTKNADEETKQNWQIREATETNNN